MPGYACRYNPYSEFPTTGDLPASLGTFHISKTQADDKVFVGNGSGGWHEHNFSVFTALATGVGIHGTGNQAVYLSTGTNTLLPGSVQSAEEAAVLGFTHTHGGPLYGNGHDLHGFENLTPGATYYLGTGQGEIVETAPVVVGGGYVIVGEALSPTELAIMIESIGYFPI